MNGPFGNGFPYTNFHELNMDWIIRIAKDFLDQYTHIQDIISSGETSLQETTAAGIEALQAEKTRLEGLLDAWYTEHSEDIAGELTSAIADFQTAAEAIGADVIASIPADYTALSTEVDTLKNAVSEDTVNLWTYGNVSGTRAISKTFEFVNGRTYTVSCKITSTRTDVTKSRVSITDSSSHEKMYTTLDHNGSRVHYTFTAIEDCDRIIFYSANTSTNSTGYDVSVTEIQIEEGETMTAYVPPVTATDFVARNRLTVVETDLGNISEKDDEPIIYTFSDKSGTGYVNIKFDFETAKTYTIYAKITSSDTGTNSLIRITDAYSHVLETGTIAHDGTKHSFEFTASAGANRVYFFAASTKATSEGLTISVTDIEIRAGSESHMFPNGISAVDYVARERINDIINNPSSNVVELLSNNTYTGYDTDTFEIPATDISLGIPVIYCEAIFTRTEGVTDYPRIRMEMTNARNLTRYSIYYKVGSEGQYESREWRTPAFLWGKKSTTIRLVVPAGCSLTIRKMGYRYENCVDRTNARGINFFARPGTCNMVPELSEPAVQMALRHGYDTFTVIPKISSDGIWFCYHDDRWVETGADKTYMVNADGSAITEDQYNNLQFHQIPFEGYLDQFVTGEFGNTFYTTKLMKLEDCCAILAKTGMKLRFSMHPSAGVNSHLDSLKRLVQKYGLLKDLSIIVNDISAQFPQLYLVS